MEGKRMIPEVIASLDAQDRCPSCGASWTEMAESAREGVASDNFQTAIVIIRACAVCRIRFRKELAAIYEPITKLLHTEADGIKATIKIVKEETWDL